MAPGERLRGAGERTVFGQFFAGMVAVGAFLRDALRADDDGVHMNYGNQIALAGAAMCGQSLTDDSIMRMMGGHS